MPVKGARTETANSAPMPAMAKVPACKPSSGNKVMAPTPNAVPSKVPNASIGAKMPPGAPEQKHSSVVSMRAKKMKSSRLNV